MGDLLVSDSDHADYGFCDVCGKDIPFGVQCWMVTTGLDQDLKVPIVKMICNACHC